MKIHDRCSMSDEYRCTFISNSDHRIFYYNVNIWSNPIHEIYESHILFMLYFTICLKLASYSTFLCDYISVFCLISNFVIDRLSF